MRYYEENQQNKNLYILCLPRQCIYRSPFRSNKRTNFKKLYKEREQNRCNCKFQCLNRRPLDKFLLSWLSDELVQLWLLTLTSWRTNWLLAFRLTKTHKCCVRLCCGLSDALVHIRHTINIIAHHQRVTYRRAVQDEWFKPKLNTE